MNGKLEETNDKWSKEASRIVGRIINSDIDICLDND